MLAYSVVNIELLTRSTEYRHDQPRLSHPRLVCSSCSTCQASRTKVWHLTPLREDRAWTQYHWILLSPKQTTSTLRLRSVVICRKHWMLHFWSRCSIFEQNNLAQMRWPWSLMRIQSWITDMYQPSSPNMLLGDIHTSMFRSVPPSLTETHNCCSPRKELN